MPSKKPPPQEQVPPACLEPAPEPGFEDEMRIFIEQSPATMAMFDREMRYLQVSRLWRADFGLGDRVLRGQSHYEVVPHVPQRCREIHRRALNGETVRCNHDCWEAADGSVRWRTWEARPWRDASGSIGGILVHGSDATAHQQMSEKLWESDATLRGFFEHLRVGAAQIDQRGRFIRVNEGFCALIGYSRGELLGGMTPIDLVHPDDREEAEKMIKRHLAGEGYEVERRYLRKDGQVVRVHISAAAILDADGRFLCSAAVIEDITARKAAQEKLERSQKLLWEAERLSNTGAGELDLITGVWTHSDQWRAIHGCSQTLLTTEELMQIAHPDDRPAIEKAFRDLLAGEAPYEVRHRIIRQDTGEVRIVQAYGELIRDGSGKPVRALGVAQDITRRVEAETALREREMFLGSVMNSSLCAIYVFDIERGSHCFVNRQYSVMTGYSLEEITSMTGQEFLSVFHPEDLPNVLQHIEDVARAADGEVREIEYRYRTADGTWKWALSRDSIFLRNPGGAKAQLIGSALDITDRKQAEEALRESEERFRQFMNNSPTIAWIKDEEGRRVYVSKAYEERFGLRLADWQGKTDADLWPAEIAETFRQNDLAVLEADHPIQVAEETVNADGTRCYWLAIKFPFRDAAGRRFVGGIGLDITQQRRAETALRRAHERYELVQSGVGAGIWDWDVPSGKVIYSHGWKTMRGFEEEEIGDSEEEWSRRIHPEDIQRVMAGVEAHFEGKTPFFHEEYRTQRKDGSWMWIADRGIVCRDADGRVVRMAGAEVDVTLRKEAEAKLRERENELNRVLETAATGLARCTRDFRYVWANSPFTKFMEVPLDQLLGLKVVDVIGEVAFEMVRPYLERVLRGERVEYESEIPYKQGNKFVHVVLTPDVNTERQVVGWFVSLTDVTEQKSLEREVLRLAEDERQRVAVELHDDICQELIAAGFNAKSLQRKLEKEEHELAAQMKTLTHAISQTAAHTRLIAHGMNPVVDSADGLTNALRELALVTSERHPLRCRFQCGELGTTFSPLVSTQIYRIAQGATHNAVKHSGASRIELSLSETDSEICLRVTDNGSGMPEGADSGSGFGLRAMKYRAGLIHGHLTIRTGEGEGTEIMCRIPKRQVSGKPKADTSRSGREPSAR